MVQVTCQDTAGHRFPFVENIFSPKQGHALVYCSDVTLIDDTGKPQPFLIFFINTQTLPYNKAIRSIHPDIFWRGDVLIMRRGRGFHQLNRHMVDGPIDLIKGDKELIDNFVLRL